MAGIYDGDVWCPSGMFPADEMASFQFQRNTYQYYSAGPHSGSGYFTACDLSPYNSQFYRPAIQRGSVLSGAYGTGNRMTDVNSAYNEYDQFVFPVQNQAERLMREVRMARVLQGRNLGIVGGYEQQKGLIRDEYRVKGTGVFIPRASSFPNNSGIAAAPTTKTRETGPKEKSKNRVHSQKISGKKLEKRKEAECNYQLPPELALPQEWTY